MLWFQYQSEKKAEEQFVQNAKWYLDTLELTKKYKPTFEKNIEKQIPFNIFDYSTEICIGVIVVSVLILLGHSIYKLHQEELRNIALSNYTPAGGGRPNYGEVPVEEITSVLSKYKPEIADMAFNCVVPSVTVISVMNLLQLSGIEVSPDFIAFAKTIWRDLLIKEYFNEPMKFYVIGFPIFVSEFLKQFYLHFNSESSTINSCMGRGTRTTAVFANYNSHLGNHILPMTNITADLWFSLAKNAFIYSVKYYEIECSKSSILCRYVGFNMINKKYKELLDTILKD